MLRSAQPGQFSTYPIQNIDIPDLAVLNSLKKAISLIKNAPLTLTKVRPLLGEGGEVVSPADEIKVAGDG